MNVVTTRAVEPEPKQFWMAGAGAGNLGSGSTALVSGTDKLHK